MNKMDKYAGAIHVLIESSESQPLSSQPRRSSLAPPSLPAKRQRTATTLHPSLLVPDALIASLLSTTVVTIQPSILPLPAARPLLLLVPIEDHLPQELSTTPSALCFPAMSAPDPQGLRRALAPLKHATRQLQSARVQPDLAIVVYSADVHLPQQIADAAFDMGAHALLTPPFTPDSVESAIHQAINKHRESSLTTLPPTPDSPSKSLPSLESSQEQLPTPITAKLATFTFEYPEVPIKARRASVDNGGLALSVSDGSGSGWASHDPSKGDLEVAQLVLEMHAQTTSALEAPVPPPPTIHPSTRSRLIYAMSTWAYEPYKLLPDEILICASLIFENLLTLPNLPHQISSLSLQQNILPFLTQLRGLYRAANKYHSFIHATDVLQAIYVFLERAGVMPPIARLLLRDQGEVLEPWERVKPKDGGDSGMLGLLTDADVFMLCIAAIGHDVGHPGNSNAFLKNAQAPLSRLYDDKSALERMHCTILLRLLQRHGMSSLIDTVPTQTSSSPSSSPPSPTSSSLSSSHTSSSSSQSSSFNGRDGRKIITGTILATDMSWHFEWLERFGRAVGERVNGRGNNEALKVEETESGERWVLSDADQNQKSEGEGEGEKGECSLSSEERDKEDRLFICQGLMKCADISNPTRPHHISQHWSTVLLEEWATQALLERQLGLPVSVVADANEKVQAAGQVGFINLFVGPLFEAVSKGVPSLKEFLDLCMENKAMWEDRLARYDNPNPNPSPVSPTSPPSASSSSLSTPSHRSPRGPRSPRSTSNLNNHITQHQHRPQVLRPVPLVTPILPPMVKYSKTVFPLSLPSVTPPGARRLSKVSPWANSGANNNSNTNGATSSSSSRPTTPGSPTNGTAPGTTPGSGFSPFSPTSPNMLTRGLTSSSTATTGGSTATNTQPTVWEHCKGLDVEVETLRNVWGKRCRKRARTVIGSGTSTGVDATDGKMGALAALGTLGPLGRVRAGTFGDSKSRDPLL